MKKRLKKGFTLAELLIVVAIIAVLTAIAVPLFVTSLNKAKNAAKNANIESVREAAIVAILTADEPSGKPTADTVDTKDKIYSGNSDGSAWELKGPWLVKGEIKDGKVTVTIVEGGKGTTIGENKSYTETTEADGKKTITVYVLVELSQLPGQTA